MLDTDFTEEELEIIADIVKQASDTTSINKDIFKDVPLGPKKKEETIIKNIKEAKRLKNLPIEGLTNIKDVSFFNNNNKAFQIYYNSLAEKYWIFYNYVKTEGIWDYKDEYKNKEYEDFGNFHYGVVGTAAGISKQILLRCAGFANQKDNKNNVPKEWGNWYDTKESSYGDDPKDQAQIKTGIKWYEKNKGYFK